MPSSRHAGYVRYVTVYHYCFISFRFHLNKKVESFLRTDCSVCFVLNFLENDGVKTIVHVLKVVLGEDLLPLSVTSDKTCTAGIRDNVFPL